MVQTRRQAGPLLRARAERVDHGKHIVDVDGTVAERAVAVVRGDVARTAERAEGIDDRQQVVNVDLIVAERAVAVVRCTVRGTRGGDRIVAFERFDEESIDAGFHDALRITVVGGEAELHRRCQRNTRIAEVGGRQNLLAPEHTAVGVMVGHGDPRAGVAIAAGFDEQPIERDYWDVELSDGGIYRIYQDRRSQEWFADGIYD